MNKIKYITVLFILIVCGCNENNTEPQLTKSALLRIDLQSKFIDDSVQVEMDGNEIFKGRVTTNDILSLAKAISINTNSGQHNVKVQIIHPFTGSEKDTTVVVSDTLTVAVTLDQMSWTIDFTLYPFVILYE